MLHQRFRSISRLLQAANITGTVPVDHGGTGATTAQDARTNLGLGTIATQDADDVAITGGSVSGITDLAVADGGTGASTGQAAAESLSVDYGVADLTALKALTSRPPVVTVKTGQAKGVWQWELGSSTTADDALVVQCTSGTAGRYKRIYDGDIFCTWFGTSGDGVTDDTAALDAADLAAQAAGRGLHIPGGTYIITSAALANNVTGHKWTGDGQNNTIIKASGNFAQLLEIQSDSDEFLCQGIGFDTTGTTTRCVKITRGQTPRFEDCAFTGDLNGTLVFSTGDICQWSHCRWDADSANTVGLELDEFNQNCSIDSNSRFGGIGKGLKISRSGANARVEGLKIADGFFINTGASNIEIGNSFLTTITGCVIDQAATNGVLVSGSADKVVLDGNWIGMAGATGNCVQFNSDSGSGHIVSNNQFYGGARGVVVQASAGARVANVLIDGNIFDNMATDAIELDSVNGCTIVNNVDRSSSPSSGSWVTSGTHASKGSYTFGNNRWSSAAQAALDTASTYLYINEAGLVNTDWLAYTPTVTSGSGTITTVGTVIGRYRRINKTVEFFVNCVITTNGTGASFVAITLPSTGRTASGTYISSAQGFEPGVANCSLFGRINSADNKVQLFKFDGSYPGADSARLVAWGSYEEP